jgi:4-phytase/acid phosphatase
MATFAAVRPVSAFRLGCLSLLLLLLCGLPVAAQNGADAKLEFVVVLSRHGVRPPIGNLRVFDKYSAAPWPAWEVPPGYLTPHGYDLMKLVGAWDRERFSAEGLFAPGGCGDARHVTILADSDERTRETGKALAEGMFPGCGIEVHAKAEGVRDPLYGLAVDVPRADKELATAAVAGRVGGDAARVTEAYRPQLEELDRVLAGCGRADATNAKRISIFDIPAKIDGVSDVSWAYRGPLSTASTMVENFLLEYTDGKPDADVGWGCVDGAKLRALMQLDTAEWNLNDHTPAVTRIYAANLLDHILRSMEQKVNGAAVAGALAKPDDRMLILVGHDTNIVTVAGALGIDWMIDGRVDDTPPGGALLFEVWREAGGERRVRVEYTAQTLEQMRQAQPLTAANPPAIAPVFIPGCSGKDGSCTWEGFSAAVRRAIDSRFVSNQPMLP